jgi:hypothetical protein
MNAQAITRLFHPQDADDEVKQRAGIAAGVIDLPPAAIKLCRIHPLA